MEDVIFTTPAGHKATIKPFLTFPEKRRIQRVFFDAATMDGNTQQPDFKMSVVLDAQDAVFRAMVKRIVLADGRTFDGGMLSYEALAELDDADAQAIFDKLDELTKDIDIFPKQKKGASKTS